MPVSEGHEYSLGFLTVPFPGDYVSPRGKKVPSWLATSYLVGKLRHQRLERLIPVCLAVGLQSRSFKFHHKEPLLYQIKIEVKATAVIIAPVRGAWTSFERPKHHLKTIDANLSKWHSLNMQLILASSLPQTLLYWKNSVCNFLGRNSKKYLPVPKLTVSLIKVYQQMAKCRRGTRAFILQHDS